MTEQIKDENCLFCKIVDGKIPSYKVYEDEEVFGFLTIFPHTKGHMLLIPKKHTLDILSADESTSDNIFRTGKKLALEIKKIINPDKVGFILAGQGVPHLHLHLIPMNDQKDLSFENAYPLSEEEAKEILELYKF
jgi:histidine triad (HIT) family protein